MEATTEPAIDSLPYQYGTPKYAGHRMTKADFLRWESDDNYVYEFNDGVLEPTTSTGILEPTTSMRQEEILMLRRLTRRFHQTNAYEQEGELVAEVDVWVTEKQQRRPDVAYYTASQLGLIATGELVIPTFVIEFVSKSDDAQKYIRKLNEYFQAGVQAVWLVFPTDQIVYVYTSPKIVTICTDDDMLSAVPALPELTMTVAELFKQ